MIAYLSGIVHSIESESEMIIRVDGIGYLVSAPERVVSDVHAGAPVEVWTYQHVRDDAIDLFAFLSRDDQGVFLQLLKVSGVGPRMALAMLSQFSSSDLRSAIATEDVTLLSTVSGVGKKTAERIVLELKDKVGVIDVAAPSISSAEPSAIDALISLGYSRQEAIQALAQVSSDLSVEDQVKQALAQLVSS